MEWRQNGRQLNTASANGKNLSYAYNDQGIRTQKTVDGVTTEYYLNGSAIYTQVTGSTRLDFLYDDAGDLLGFLYNGRGYYYVRNGQNDITGILNSDGTQIVSYTYDAWGAPTSTTGTEADTIGSLNPFRYRGYYYDAESSLYYLNSRYYDPQVGRFLNADAFLGANKDLLSNNVFAYCSNNPVNYSDPSGHGKIWDKIKKTVKDVTQKVKDFFGFQNKVTVDTPHSPEIYGWNGVVDVKTGTKNSVTTTYGKKKTVNFYSSNSNSGSGVGVEVGNVSVSKGISSKGRRTTSISVADDRVVRTVSFETLGNLSSFSLSYSEMSLGEISSGYYVSLNSNLALYAGLAVATYVVCAPAMPFVIAFLEKWIASGGSQNSPAFG